MNALPNGVSRAPSLDGCESPIESLLVRAVVEEVARCRLQCVPVTQAKIGPYRADIMIEMGERRLIVECDGAAYHAANKEQIARDKQRDRFFVAQNISVMRFTGSEINRSPRACAAEIGSWLEAAASALKAQIIDKHCAGELSSLQTRRLIIRHGLANA